MIASPIIALMLAGLVVLYVHDRRQTSRTFLRKHPVVGYIRYFAETLGEYMRQVPIPAGPIPVGLGRAPVRPAGTRLSVPLGQGRLRSARLRQRDRDRLRMKIAEHAGAGP